MIQWLNPLEPLLDPGSNQCHSGDTRGMGGGVVAHRRLLDSCTYFSVFSGAGTPFRRVPSLWDRPLHLHPATSHMGRFAQSQWMGSKPPPGKRDWEIELKYSATDTPQDLSTENLNKLTKDRAGDLVPALKISISGPIWTRLVAQIPVWGTAKTHLFCCSHFCSSTSQWVNQEEVKHQEGKGMAAASVVSVCRKAPAPHQCMAELCRKHRVQKAFKHIHAKLILLARKTEFPHSSRVGICLPLHPPISSWWPCTWSRVATKSWEMNSPTDLLGWKDDRTTVLTMIYAWEFHLKAWAATKQTTHETNTHLSHF